MSVVTSKNPSWEQVLNGKARLLHQQIASSQRWVEEAGDGEKLLEELSAPYYELLTSIYEEDFPLIRKRNRLNSGTKGKGNNNPIGTTESSDVITATRGDKFRSSALKGTKIKLIKLPNGNLLRLAEHTDGSYEAVFDDGKYSLTGVTKTNSVSEKQMRYHSKKASGVTKAAKK